MKKYHYESVIIFLSELDEKGINAQLEKVEGIISSHGGTIEQKEVWGRRELAYKIAKKTHGIYTLLVFTGDEALVQDLDRQLKINDSALRHLIVKKDEFAPDWTPGRRHDDSMPIDGSAPFGAPSGPSFSGVDEFLPE